MSYWGEIWETNLYINNHGYRSIPRYIRVLFGSYKVNVLDILEVSL